MRIGRFKVSQHAVSPVIATLLMIAIAVAASIIVYVWSIGLLGGLMGGGGSQTKEQLILEAYNWNSTSLKATLRNVGSATVQIASWYISGNAQSGSWTPATVAVLGTSTYNGAFTGSYASGVAYTLKVVSVTGGVFAFSVIYGSSS
jgi:hypothetical protein